MTFSCYRRQPKLGTPSARAIFEHALERTRNHYRFCVIGYVIPLEHVHLPVSEPWAAGSQKLPVNLCAAPSPPTYLNRGFSYRGWGERVPMKYDTGHEDLVMVASAVAAAMPSAAGVSAAEMACLRCLETAPAEMTRLRRLKAATTETVRRVTASKQVEPA